MQSGLILGSKNAPSRLRDPHHRAISFPLARTFSIVKVASPRLTIPANMLASPCALRSACVAPWRPAVTRGTRRCLEQGEGFGAAGRLPYDRNQLDLSHRTRRAVGWRCRISVSIKADRAPSTLGQNDRRSPRRRVWLHRFGFIGGGRVRMPSVADGAARQAAIRGRRRCARSNRSAFDRAVNDSISQHTHKRQSAL